jgi:hypothetical protein
MKNISISGLAISLTIGRSVTISRCNGPSVLAEIILKKANPSNQSATLEISISGEKGDVLALCLPTLAKTIIISSQWTTEVLPGIRVAICNGGSRPFTTTRASLVIDAPRSMWTILRDNLAEKALREHSRALPVPTPEE